MIFEAGLATPNEVKGEACQRQNENVSSFKKIMKGIMVAQVAPEVKNPSANAGDAGSIPGLGRSFGKGNGNPLQYSYLRNPMDRRACRLQSMGLQKIQTRFSD